MGVGRRRKVGGGGVRRRRKEEEGVVGVGRRRKVGWGGRREAAAAAGSPAPWCDPRAPGCGWSQCAPSLPAAGGTAGAGGGGGKRATYTGGTGGEHPTPPESRDPGAWGGRTHRRPEMRGREAWDPRKLKAPSHGHPFPQVWVPNGNSRVFPVAGPPHWPTWATSGGGQFPPAETPQGSACSPPR